MGGIAREAKAQENLRYEVTEIEIPGVYLGALEVKGLNDQGMILVYDDYSDKSFICSDGKVREIDIGASKINDFGEVLFLNSIYKLGEKINLDFLGEDMSNTAVVGNFWVGGRPPAYPPTAYMYLLESNQKIELGNFKACLVNDNRKIAGYFYDPNHSYYRSAVVWENGVLKKLEKLCYGPEEDPACFKINLSDINNEGKIVGTSYWDIWEKPQFACMWDENGRITQLDTNPLSKATAINDNDQVVGTSTTETNIFFAVLYQKDKQNNIVKINLNELFPEYSKQGWSDWRLWKGLYINNRGQIICWGIGYKQGSAYFLLTPKPLPSADLTGDGIVNLRDLSELAEHWLEEK